MKFNRLAAANDEKQAVWAQWLEAEELHGFTVGAVWYLVVGLVFLGLMVLGSVRVLELLIDRFAWLFWPAVGTLGIMAMLFAMALVAVITLQWKRWDTATQSVRGASQGRIELVGRCQAPGEPLISPLFGIPCVDYRSRMVCMPNAAQAEEAGVVPEEVVPKETSGGGEAGTTAEYGGTAKSGQLVWREQKSLDALLLDDEGYRVFVPIVRRDDLTEIAVKLRATPPLEQLRSDVRQFLSEKRATLVSCHEVVVPVDRLIQANAVFKTLNSDDDYVSAHQRRLGHSDDEFTRARLKPVEDAWKRYASEQEAAAGGERIRLDTLLPLSSLKGIALTAKPYDLFKFTSDVVVLSICFVALIYFLLSWFDLVPLLPYFGLARG